MYVLLHQSNIKNSVVSNEITKHITKRKGECKRLLASKIVIF